MGVRLLPGVPMDNINIKIYNLENLEQKGILPIIDMVRNGNDGIISIRKHDKIKMEMGTGLMDSNNKEIYTGDIAVIYLLNEFGSTEKRLGLMTFSGGSFKFDLSGADSYEYLPSTRPPTVIGSRNSDPGLLEKYKKGEMLL